ncbi:MAG: large conductance mechanosensitive channel [Patescibacteria group bacterium]|nr:large conductance mechanosensitive channel [Patescibacteria group bacterium]
MKKYLQEFKEFAIKGNVIDLAVAVIIGGAFGKIVSSFVNDIIMPLFGVILGGIDFTNYKWILVKESFSETGALLQAEVAVKIGIFLQNIVNFLIIALAIFMMVKVITKSKEKLAKKQGEKKKEEDAPRINKEEALLTEIRDILKNNK